MSDIEYSVITNDVIKSFGCIFLETQESLIWVALSYLVLGHTLGKCMLLS